MTKYAFSVTGSWQNDITSADANYATIVTTLRCIKCHKSQQLVKKNPQKGGD